MGRDEEKKEVMAKIGMERQNGRNGESIACIRNYNVQALPKMI